MSELELAAERGLIEMAACAAHEANRVLCLAIGDTSQPRWRDAPEWQRESARNGVRFLIDNPEVTPEDQHVNWMIVKAAEGWVYGEIKDPERKTHPCMRPYHELPEQQRLKDEMFRIVVGSALQWVD